MNVPLFLIHDIILEELAQVKARRSFLLIHKG
jgi:hypothetical protein